MKRRVADRLRLPKAVELARQNADFTAEGAPPPGVVATALPLRRATAVPQSHKLQR